MRAAIDADAVRPRIVHPGGLVTSVTVVDETRSTNADLLAAAGTGAGAADGTLLIAEYQAAGRGRFDRSWTVPPRAGLLMSLLVRPGAVPREQWGWLPLLTGLAVRAAVVAGRADEAAALKWPNDLQLGPRRRKAAGILVQASGDAAVIGIGLNVDQTAAELPIEQATSLRIEFGDVDRTEVLVAVCAELEARYTAWVGEGGRARESGLLAEYERHCETLGRDIRLERADGVVTGRARAIDEAGSLVVETPAGTATYSAGDVVHLRPGER